VSDELDRRADEIERLRDELDAARDEIEQLRAELEELRHRKAAGGMAAEFDQMRVPPSTPRPRPRREA
jgi:predicted RNase H-like nuclease (RuvC/YqgF family)